MKPLFLFSSMLFSALAVVDGIPIPRNVHGTITYSKDRSCWKGSSTNVFKSVRINQCEERFSVGNAVAQINQFIHTYYTSDVRNSDLDSAHGRSHSRSHGAFITRAKSIACSSTDPNPGNLKGSSKPFFLLRPNLSALNSLLSRDAPDKSSGHHAGGSKYESIIAKNGSLRPWVVVVVIGVLIPVAVALVYIAEYVTRLMDHEGAVELVEGQSARTYVPRQREEDELSENSSSNDEEYIVP